MFAPRMHLRTRACDADIIVTELCAEIIHILSLIALRVALCERHDFRWSGEGENSVGDCRRDRGSESQRGGNLGAF